MGDVDEKVVWMQRIHRCFAGQGALWKGICCACRPAAPSSHSPSNQTAEVPHFEEAADISCKSAPVFPSRAAGIEAASSKRRRLNAVQARVALSADKASARLEAEAT